MNEEFRKNEVAMMRVIKALHSQIDLEHIDKSRQSQRNLGTLWKVSKEVKYEEVMIGNIPAEWTRANRRHSRKYVILYCHGGGFFTGSLEYARMITSKLAMTTSMDVLSFNYRLAPEHPFPAALEDAVQVWNSLMLLGYGATDVVVAGDSAGGNLALTLAHKLRMESRQLPRALVCLSPWTDLLCEGRSHESRKEVDPILAAEYLDWAIQAYAGEADLKNPLISPLYGDYRNFPPVYVQVGNNEILLSDAKNLHKTILQAGSFCKIDVFKGMWHDFQMVPFKPAYDAIDQIADFITALEEGF